MINQCVLSLDAFILLVYISIHIFKQMSANFNKKISIILTAFLYYYFTSEKGRMYAKNRKIRFLHTYIQNLMF